MHELKLAHCATVVTASVGALLVGDGGSEREGMVQTAAVILEPTRGILVVVPLLHCVCCSGRDTLAPRRRALSLGARTSEILFLSLIMRSFSLCVPLFDRP